VLASVHPPPASAPKGGAPKNPERVSAMSDSQLTSIARLSERLTALKERL